MIIIRYKGGLGNQMFQYAFQQAMMRRYPDEVIKADISHYRMQPEHNGFELKKVFDITLDYASLEEVRQITNLYAASEKMLRLPDKWKQKFAAKYQHKVTKWNGRLHKKKEQNYYRCRFHNSYEDVVFHLNLEHDWYLEGLWQNLNYFLDCEEQIKRSFSFHKESILTEMDRQMLREIESHNSVSVHVRRGDFVNSKFDICNAHYYQTAMREIEDKVPEILYFFFTDDFEFVEREFVDIKNKRIISHDIESSVLDMQMMSQCRHNIISNSTFSYWGAYLNKNTDKYVIAPRYSIRNAIGAYELSAPADWILIEV